MKAELRKMTRKELEKLKLDVEKALERVEVREMKTALAAAEKAAAAHGFSLSEITGETTPAKPKKRKTSKNAGTPKYRNPADKTQTWTGKGRQPTWFKDALTAGKTPEAMEI